MSPEEEFRSAQEDAFLDVEAVAREIRQRVERRFPVISQAAASVPAEAGTPAPVLLRSSRQHAAPALAGDDLARLHQEIAAANLLQHTIGSINPRPAGWHNDFIQSVKKGIVRALNWYTRSLQEFHGAVVRSLNEIKRALENIHGKLGALDAMQAQMQILDTMQARLQTLSEREEQFAEWVTQLRTSSLSLDERMECLERELPETFNQRLRSQERTLRRLAHIMDNGGAPVAPQTSIAPMFPSEIRSEADFDYFQFAEQFRGPEKLIKERQLEFVKYFRGREGVLDLGCGRGEFLELLRENGVPAEGVELGTDAYLLCREKGLEVKQDDLFRYLESFPDASVGGIFCSQVIEHLPAGLQIRLVILARQKLSAGAPLIVESINPECVYALARNFFLDPTHVRPIHPEMLAFLMRSLKFENVELKFSSPAPGGPLPKLAFADNSADVQRFNDALERVNAALFGFQDYAAIGLR